MKPEKHQHSTNRNSNKNTPQNPRVILLLDLDCFYAQCEMIRLNINPQQPLCLLQWNAALAVNYPARDLYNFKRGASFEEIQTKSKGNCVALHLPVMTLDNHVISPTKNDTSDGNIKEEGEEEINPKDIIRKLYNQEYNQPQYIKTQLYNQEKNIMKKPSDGKASLERYRIASSYIFEIIKQELQCQKQFYVNTTLTRTRAITHTRESQDDCDNDNRDMNVPIEDAVSDYFILEKASIDELYLDVTNICYDFTISSVWTDNNETTTSSCSSDKSITNPSNAAYTHKDSDANNDQIDTDTTCTTNTITSAMQTPQSLTIDAIAMQETIIYAKDNIQIIMNNNNNNNNHNDNNQYIDSEDQTIQALLRGCTIAKGIRKAIYDKLGFTLSAGISTSKLVAKLGASFGKPNGQAVIFPQAIPFLMDETPIRKARNLGGKIGKEVREKETIKDLYWISTSMSEFSNRNHVSYFLFRLKNYYLPTKTIPCHLSDNIYPSMN